MKKLIIISSLIVFTTGIANAKPQDTTNFLNQLTLQVLSPSKTQVIETANRKGSKRVGGSGRSGKGSHYTGGRK